MPIMRRLLPARAMQDDWREIEGKQIPVYLFVIREEAMTLIESIYQTPESWKPGEHYFTHTSGARLWIANGVLFCQPDGGGFTLLNKWRAWRAYRWWRSNAPVEAHGRTSA